MKKAFLIGDSIRFGAPSCTPPSPGYGRYVQEYLGESWQVDAPNDNCRFAQYTQRYIWEWAAKTDAAQIDVVHWNNGLWDIIELEGADGVFTDLPFYLATLKKVAEQLRFHFPNARIIFATSTPVVEEKRPACFGRRNEIIRQYNEAAARLMGELGIAVDDLYSVAVKMGESTHSDWVHFGEEGSRILAAAVAECIRKEGEQQ